MKKTIFLLTILSLLALPMAASASVSAPTTPGAIEFTLGGYVKMETDWDSTQMNKNMTQPVLRNNNTSFHHGRLKFTANSTRFNFNVKGPKLWGAQVTGLIEMDFDAGGNAAAGLDTLQTGNFRVRHAMFRLNWPETELLLGMYWGFFSEFTPEQANDSGCQFVGSATHRPPQIRLTQKFLGAYTVSMMVAAPTNMLDQSFAGTAAGAAATGLNNPTPGESTECPMLQGKVSFEQDLWGKAAFYGVPRGFVAQVAAGWQRTRYRAFTFPDSVTGPFYNTWGQDQFGTIAGRQRNQQYLNPWMVQGSLFIPLIPTYSANLAGTASISTQWYVGAGLDAFGEAIANNASFFVFQQTVGGVNQYDRELVHRYGGFVQGQYYFTNQWFMNVVWGMSKAFDVNQDRDVALYGTAGNLAGYKIGLPADLYKFWQEYNLTLWYRPITALKFGLQYSYVKTDWFQKAGPTVTADPHPSGARVTGIGENHRVMFAGFFYF